MLPNIKQRKGATNHDKPNRKKAAERFNPAEYTRRLLIEGVVEETRRYRLQVRARQESNPVRKREGNCTYEFSTGLSEPTVNMRRNGTRGVCRASVTKWCGCREAEARRVWMNYAPTPCYAPFHTALYMSPTPTISDRAVATALSFVEYPPMHA